MTILFPRLGSRELQPYEAPFGRMMLAFGRAAAAIELVAKCKGSEAAPSSTRRLLVIEFRLSVGRASWFT
jgi:hypothetical protein